jgi:hypothetical protein
VPSTDRKPPYVEVRSDRIVVSFADATNGEPRLESIQLSDISRIVVERAASTLHWFLTHHSGWTLHFNDQFQGATLARNLLSAMDGFNVTALREAHASGDGESVVVWCRS